MFGGLDENVKLAIFDIDGTLTNTKSVNDGCFVKALSEAFCIDQDITLCRLAPFLQSSPEFLPKRSLTCYEYFSARSSVYLSSDQQTLIHSR